MIRFLPSQLNGTLQAPASKDHAQRLLFAAAMPPTPTVVKNIPDCDDIRTTMDCLEAFGCRIVKNEAGDEAVIDPFAKNVPVPTANFDFKKSATTSRIAIAIAAALGFKSDCAAAPGLSKRLLVPLTSRMALRGIKLSSFSLPLSFSGRLAPGEFQFDGAQDAQYVSAMLMALPVLSGDSNLVINTELSDYALVEETLSVLDLFKVEIKKTEKGFFIKGRQQYTSPEVVTADNDWALSSLWIAAGAAGRSSVKVEGLQVSSPQKYRNIMGALSMLAQDFESVSLDASGCPELATLFAALAAVKGACFDITSIPQLRYMESDRLKTIAECVKALGGSAEYTEEGITVTGSGSGFAGDTVLDCKDDPWVFMSFALASAVLGKPLTLSDESCADKIYKNFLSDFTRLGGQYENVI